MSGDIVMLNRAKYVDVKSIKDIKNFFYFSNLSISDTVVECMDNTRLKVVRLPGFIIKPNSKLVRLAPSIHIDTSVSSRANPTFIYGGFNRLYKTRNIYTKRRRPRWLDEPMVCKDTSEYHQHSTRKGTFIGNHVALYDVCENDKLVCTYAVISRTSAKDDNELNIDYIKNPDRHAVVHLDGDELYLPKNYPRVKVTSRDNVWLADGYFFTKGSLYIEPVVCVKEVHVLEERNGLWFYKLPCGGKYKTKERIEDLKIKQFRSLSSIYLKYESA